MPRRQAEDRAGRRRGRARRRQDRADQPRLHDRDRADRRPDRPRGGHRGCVRPAGRRDAARDGAAARSGLRRPDVVERRARCGCGVPSRAAQLQVDRGPGEGHARARGRPRLRRSRARSSSPTSASIRRPDRSRCARSFPNPSGELLPGMFVRARIEEGTNPSAILVPQTRGHARSERPPDRARRRQGRQGRAPPARRRSRDRRRVARSAPGSRPAIRSSSRACRRCGRAPSRSRPCRRRAAAGQASGARDGAVLHRPPDLRVGDRDHHHDRRRAVDLPAADLAVPGDRAARDHDQRDAIPAPRRARSRRRSRR